MPKYSSAKSKYDTEYGSTRKEKRRRAIRNKARRRAIAKGVDLEGKDMGHRSRSLKGGVRPQSISSNRSHGGKVGNKAGKARGGRKS